MRRWFLSAVLVAGASAQGAPRMAWVAVGDCRDPDLLRQANAFEARLADRVGPQLLGETQFQSRVGPPPTHSLEEVRRQVATAENLFYNDRVADALAMLDQTVGELERIPPGSERWKIFSDAQLIRGMALYTSRRREASDDAFRAVLRLDPRHVMSADAFSPLFRQRFEKLRKDLARARKVRLAVQTTPSPAGVWVDGFLLGHAPLSADLPAGSYQLVVGKPEAFSFPHPIALREDTQIRIDLAFEQAVPPSRVACLQQPTGGKDTSLGNALKLGLLLEVDSVVVLRLDRPAAGPSWLSAAVLNTQTAQRTREGGIQLRTQTGGADDLGELARFVVTGEPSERVVVMDRTASPGPLLVPVPAAPATPAAALTLSQQAPAPARTWKTPTGIALTALGAASLGLGTLFQLKANDSASKFNQAYANGAAPLPSQVGTVEQYRGDAQTQQTLAYVGWGVGAAAVSAGLWLWLSDGKPPPPATVIPGPGSVTVAGRF